MNREFRGRVKYNGNHYHSGSWVYGYYLEKNGKHYIIDNSEDEFGNVFYNQVEVILESVGQYTGLKDKNGVKIYEGDIISFNDEDNHRIKVCEESKENRSVISHLCFTEIYHRQGKAQNSPSLGMGQSYEVIGNIHEYPHLLKEK